VEAESADSSGNLHPRLIETVYRSHPPENELPGQIAGRELIARVHPAERLPEQRAGPMEKAAGELTLAVADLRAHAALLAAELASSLTRLFDSHAVLPYRVGGLTIHPLGPVNRAASV
jgi:hypothetical protein